MLKKYTGYLILFISSVLISILSFSKECLPQSSYKPEMHEWRVLKTLHFDIYYTDININAAELCSKIAEDNYIFVSNYLNYEINNVVYVIIPDSELAENLNIFNNGRENKFCEFSDSAEDYLFLSFKGSIENFRDELTHKLVHRFQYEILFGESPSGCFSDNSLSFFSELLTEAMALYIASGCNEFTDMVIFDTIESSPDSDLFDISSYDSCNRSFNPEIGKSFYSFIEKHYGKDKISDILFNSVTDDFVMAVETVLNSDINIINKKWVQFFKERYSNAGLHALEEKSENFFFKSKDQGNYNIPLKVKDKNIYFLCIKDNNYEVYKSDSTGKNSELIFIYSSTENPGYLQNVLTLHNLPSISVNKGRAAYLKIRNKRDTVVIYDFIHNKIIEEVILPFNKISDVSLSEDGNRFAFTGVNGISSNVYIYDINNKLLIQITDDDFSKRFSVISPDNSYIVYCRNNYQTKNPKQDSSILMKYDLNEKKETIIETQKNILHPYISSDGEKIVYSANISGIYDLYSCDIDTGKKKQITHNKNSAFFPCHYPDSNKILYSTYNNNALNICSAESEGVEISGQGKRFVREYEKRNYPASFFDSRDAVLIDYKDGCSTVLNTFVSGKFNLNDYLLSAASHLGDYLNNYNFIVNADYQNIEDNNYVNINLEYDYLKFYTDFGIRLYYRSNPVYNNSFFLPKLLNSHLRIYSSDPDLTESGIRLLSNYPVLGNISFVLEAGSSWHNDMDSSSNTENDCNSNILTAGLKYNSFKSRNSNHENGIRFEISFTNSFDISGNDNKYNSVNIIFATEFNFFNRFFLTLNAEYGRISGRDMGRFAYYLGGMDTLGGHDLLQYSGNKAFFLRSEISLLLIKRAVFFSVSSLRLRNLSIVFFLDAGSAWDENFEFRNNSGEFEDMKSGIGTGLRFQIFNHLSFKLDAAWPYFYKSIGNSQITAGFNFHY